MAIRKPTKRTLVAQTWPITLKFRNPAVVEANSDTVWTQGLKAAEGAAATGTTTLVTNPEILKKSFELRLFKTNEFITLLPGDLVDFQVNSATELAYYISIPDGETFKIDNRTSYDQEIKTEITGTATCAVGATSALNASITPADQSNSFTWESSDNGVATVATTGTVTGVAAGTCTITATPSIVGYPSATKTFVVTAAQVSGDGE